MYFNFFSSFTTFLNHTRWKWWDLNQDIEHSLESGWRQATKQFDQQHIKNYQINLKK